jgi:hypothetical protein
MVLTFPLQEFRRARSRKRLARAVRKHARAEYEHRLEAGGVDDTALEARTSLYEALAAQLEALDRRATAKGTERLNHLVSERLPLFDYGPYSRARDAELQSILAELAGDGEPQ